MKTESQCKKGMDEPKNHPLRSLPARKLDQNAENVFCLTNHRLAFLLN